MGVDSVNIAARYGAPTVRTTAGDASASILRKAIDTAANSAEQLIESLPDPGELAAAAAPAAEATALPPIGTVGHHLDIRL